MTQTLFSNSNDTLKPSEPHPAALMAKDWIASLSYEELCKWQSAFSSCAIEGNRLAEICSGTLYRLLNNLPVSDRYILGLAWAIRFEEIKNKK